MFTGPVILTIATYAFVFPPAEINGPYGYRTETSMRSQEVWDEAQRFGSTALIVAALVSIAYQVLSSFLMRPIVSLLTSGFVLGITLCISIAVTELHLRKHFDEQGQRIQAPHNAQELGVHDRENGAMSVTVARLA